MIVRHHTRIRVVSRASRPFWGGLLFCVIQLVKRMSYEQAKLEK